MDFEVAIVYIPIMLTYFSENKMIVEGHCLTDDSTGGSTDFILNWGPLGELLEQ
jgi:hypothetical protein